MIKIGDTVKIKSGNKRFEGVVNDIIWDFDHHIYNVNNEWYGTSEVYSIEHICKYCGVMTPQPDEECYKATKLKIDMCKKCLNNNTGRKSGLWCANNCINGSEFKTNEP